MATEKRTSKEDLLKKYKIKITQNGPYIVTGEVPMAEQSILVDKGGDYHGWREGKNYPLQEKYSLCRCGKSSTKPFCDGSHLKHSFDGTETASREQYLDRAMRMHGPNLDLTDYEDLCVGARFCHRGEGVWKLTEKSDNPDAWKMAVEEAADCPSGRLVTWDKNGKTIEPEHQPSIGLVTDPKNKRGPVWVRGGIPVESADGSNYEIRNHVTLCRCGKSYNKPFCDGRHLQPD